MRLITTLTILAVFASSCQAAAVHSVVIATPTPTRTISSSPSDGATRNVSIERRCNEGESCPDITAGPEVPIAVTTTMATTKIVSCTTTTTVIDSQTSTLTLWSTEVQTSTEHIQGAATVTVWLVTPAPEIKSKTWHQEETYTFIRTGTSTSFWTETQAVQTSSTTITGSSTTWTDGGKPGATDCRDCNGKGSPPASTASPSTSSSASGWQPAWTQTTALGGPAAQTGGSHAALAFPGSPSAVGWIGNAQAGGGGGSPSDMGSAAMAHAGTPPPNGYGVPLSNSVNPQGSAMSPQLNSNPAGQGAGDPINPFTNAGIAGPRFIGSSERLAASVLLAVMCAAVLL